MGAARDPVLVRNAYHVDCVVRHLASLFVATSLAAVFAIELGRRLLAGGHTALVAWVGHPTAVGPNFYDEYVVTVLPVDPSLPVWEQYVTYLVTVGTAWPILVVVGVTSLYALWYDYGR
ncbi:hypothetical protein GCM10025298_03540 [Natronobiforma cellulositropha]